MLSSTALLAVCHPGMSYKARVTNASPQGQSSTTTRCSLSQLWGSAHLSNQNQKYQQSAEALLQQQLPAGEVSAQAWQSWLFGSVVLADLWSGKNQWLCARPWLLNEGNPYSSLAQAHRKEPLEQGSCQWGFDPSVSC